MKPKLTILKDFKPALSFLGKFLAFYFITNILYGLYIESNGDVADGITKCVAVQTATVLSQFDPSVTTEINRDRPTVFIKKKSNIILNVFEGCNGINVMIVFVAFVVAFSGPFKKMAWFIPLGILAIHIANLFRLSLLYMVALKYSHYFYYIHKYFFTAAIYIIVFALWALWVFNVNKVEKSSNA